MNHATEQLEKGKIWPLVFKLTIPAVIAQLITFLYNIVDRMYVAQIDGAGMDALAALGIVLPITLIMQAFANLIGLGGAPRASMKLGENDPHEANRIFNTAFVLLTAVAIAIGIVGFCMAKQIVVLFGCPESAVEYATSYLRIYSVGSIFVLTAQGLNPFITAQGYSLIAMLSVLIGAVANIALDPLFIFGLGMGVRGASLATVISQALSFVWIVGFFFTRKSTFRLRIGDMRPHARRVWAIVALGFTPFVMTLTECAVQIVFNVNLNQATGGDKDYVAALTIMLSALQLISLPLNGLGYGMQPFVSYNYGKGNAARLKQGIRAVTVVAFAFAIVVWTVSLAAPQVYAYLFSASDRVRGIVVAYTPFFLMGSIMFFVQMTLQNINVALGQARSALLLAVLRKVVILIPLCFALTHVYGYRGVYWSEGIADLAAGIVTAVVIFATFPRVFRRRAEQVERQRAAQDRDASARDDKPIGD